MQTRWIINFLIIIAIVILTVIARYEPGLDAPAGPQAISALTLGQITRIQVNRPLREDLVFTRTDAQWTLMHEPELPADSYQVRALARLAEQTAVRSYAAADLDLGKLALDPAYASVTLNNIRVDFGSVEPLEELRYVRVGGQVHLISDMYQHLIEADLTQFVRRRLFAEGSQIKVLELPGFTLRKSAGKWLIDPQQAVSADALQQLVDNWQQAAARYVRPTGATADGEMINVTLEHSQRPVEFRVVSRLPELVLRRTDYALDYRFGDLADALLALPQAAVEDNQ